VSTAVSLPREERVAWARPWTALERRWFLVLLGFALATRLVWVLWIHPPAAYVFSDMEKYVQRAQHLAEHGLLQGHRAMAWQVWGTHYLLAVPLLVFGKTALWACALLNGLLATAAVPLGYLLARRLDARPWFAPVVGACMALWYPHLSLAGFFLSETPFLCFQLAATYGLVVVLQEGRGAWWAGLAAAAAFAIRPQVAIFLAAVFFLVVSRWRSLPVRPRHLVAVGVPLAAVFAFSLGRFWFHTGYLGGIAENANMNFTAGRCHNIVTQAFATEADLERSNRAGSTRDGRRVALPGFRTLLESYPAEHPLALRPALGSDTVKFVGYIGDPRIHDEIQQRCLAATGTLEQLRYAVVNVMLSWFVARPWPEMERDRQWFLPPADAFRRLFQVVFWLPSLVGIGWALRVARRRPELLLPAFQLLSMMVTAALFFGDIRLRTPYDPYAFILALQVCAAGSDRLRERWALRG
jgi:hypothetical protein